MASTPLINGTDFICVGTTDIDRAVAFYGETVGIDDFEAAQEELRSRGVEFEGEPLDSGVCPQAFFADPDGNALAIHHRYAEGTPPAEAG